MASYRKNLMLSLGPISTSVDLETVAPKKSSGLNRLCPDHTVKLSQKYKCPGTSDADEHEVVWGSWDMGYETADGYKIVDEAAKPEVESVGGLALTPVPKKDLESATLEGDGLYYAKPSNAHAESTWAIFNKLVSGKTALIARGALRKGTNTEKLWRVTTFNRYLVLREIRFPENLKPSPEAISKKVDKATYELVAQFADKLTTEWSDFDSTDTMSARMADWMDEGTEAVPSPIHDTAAPQLDLKAALVEALKE